MRLFVALQISDEVREAIARLVGELKPLDNSWKWTRPENLHVTLKFLGETPESKLENIVGSLNAVPADLPITLNFRGLGFFPNGKRPRVFWAGMETSPNLAPLSAEIDTRLKKQGIPVETREFAPHLTLARFDPPGISDGLSEIAQQNVAREFGAVRTGEFHLFESKTRPTGAEYTRLSSFSFAPED